MCRVVQCQLLPWTVPFGTSLGADGRRRFRQLLIRSVRFALLNSEAPRPHPSRVNKQSQQKRLIQTLTTKTTSTATMKVTRMTTTDNDNHENVEKPKRGEPQNPSSFPSACVLTSQVTPSTRSALAVHAFQTQYPRVKLLARGKFLVPLAPRVALVATRDTTLTIGKTPKYTVREEASG